MAGLRTTHQACLLDALFAYSFQGSLRQASSVTTITSPYYYVSRRRRTLVPITNHSMWQKYMTECNAFTLLARILRNYKGDACCSAPLYVQNTGVHMYKGVRRHCMWQPSGPHLLMRSTFVGRN